MSLARFQPCDPKLKFGKIRLDKFIKKLIIALALNLSLSGIELKTFITLASGFELETF